MLAIFLIIPGLLVQTSGLSALACIGCSDPEGIADGGSARHSNLASATTAGAAGDGDCCPLSQPSPAAPGDGQPDPDGDAPPADPDDDRNGRPPFSLPCDGDECPEHADDCDCSTCGHCAAKTAVDRPGLQAPTPPGPRGPSRLRVDDLPYLAPSLRLDRPPQH